MTPRDWYYLASLMDEAGLNWEWSDKGTAIGLLGDDVWITAQAYQGKWLVEVEDRVRVGGYYDPPEYRHSHDYMTDDADDAVAHIESIIRR